VYANRLADFVCHNRQAFAGGGERIELAEAAPGAATRDDTFARDAPFSAE